MRVSGRLWWWLGVSVCAVAAVVGCVSGYDPALASGIEAKLVGAGVEPGAAQAISEAIAAKVGEVTGSVPGWMQLLVDGVLLVMFPGLMVLRNKSRADALAGLKGEVEELVVKVVGDRVRDGERPTG